MTYPQAYERWLSSPGRSVLINAECGWCHKIVTSDRAVPATKPEEIVSAEVELALQHWYVCPALASCRQTKDGNRRLKRETEAAIAKVGSDPRKLYRELNGREWEDTRWWGSLESYMTYVDECLNGEGLWHCHSTCRCFSVPPLRCWQVESGSGRPVIERSQVRRIARQRGRSRTQRN